MADGVVSVVSAGVGNGGGLVGGVAGGFEAVENERSCSGIFKAGY